MKKRRVVIAITMVSLATAFLVPYAGRAYVAAREHACVNNLCMLQSVIFSASMANGWDVNHSVSVAELKDFYSHEHPYPSCPSDGEYLLPETLKQERPTCSVHGDLLKKYRVPDELTRRTTNWQLDYNSHE